MPLEPRKTFELGVYTFGNTPRTADGGHGPTAQAVRDALGGEWTAVQVRRLLSRLEGAAAQTVSRRRA